MAAVSTEGPPHGVDSDEWGEDESPHAAGGGEELWSVVPRLPGEPPFPWTLDVAVRAARGTVIRHPAVRHPIVSCTWRPPSQVRLPIRWVLLSREGVICLCSVLTDWKWPCRLRMADAGRWKETPLGEAKAVRYEGKLSVDTDASCGESGVQERPPAEWKPVEVTLHPDLCYPLSGKGRGTYKYLAHNVETGEKVLLRAGETKKMYPHVVRRVFGVDETYRAGSVEITTVFPIHV